MYLRERFPANQELFHLHIPKYSNHGIKVLSFQGENFGLSQSYRVHISVTPLNSHQIHNMLGKVASFYFFNVRVIHGYLTSVTTHSLILQSPLFRLQTITRSRVYSKKTVPQLIVGLLENAGWHSFEYETRIQSNFSYPIMETFTQFNQTDYDFLIEHLSCWGFIFYFEQTTTHAKLIITDELIGVGTEHFLRYTPISGLLPGEDAIAIKASLSMPLITDHICLKTYDDTKPNTNLVLESTNSTPFKGVGVRYSYGEPYQDCLVGQRLLLIRQQALDCQRCRIFLSTTLLHINSGDLLTISGIEHLTSTNNGRFRVISLTQVGDQTAGLEISAGISKKISYINHLVLIEDHQAFRVDYQPSFNNNYEVATIDSASNIALDELGKYRIRYGFDDESLPGQGSKPVRLMQPLSGIDSGYHWPLQVGTQVLVTFINGNINEPIIVGVLPSDEAPSPVTNSNCTEYITQSYLGHYLLFEDNAAQSKILMHTNKQQQLMQFDGGQKQKIIFQTKKGHIHLSSGENITISTKANQEMNIGRNHSVQIAHQSVIATRYGDIDIQTNRDIYYFAQNSLNLTTQKQTLTWISGNDFHCSAKKGGTINLQKGNLTVFIKNGSLQICSNSNLIFKSQQNIIITQGQSKVQIQKNGDLQIQSPHIILKGMRINFSSPKTNLGEIGTSTDPLTQPIINPNNWLYAQYLLGDQAKNISNTRFKCLSSSQTNVFASHINDSGYGNLPSDKTQSFDKITLDNHEIIKVHQRLISHPNDTVIISSSDLIPVTITSKPLKQGDKRLDVYTLYPPIILNLRNDASDKYAREILSLDEITYLKQNGNNATIFIHGFYVPYGAFQKQINGFTFPDSPVRFKPLFNLNQPMFIPQASAKYSLSDQTIYSDITLLQQKFPGLDEWNLPDELKFDAINGTDAHNWFIHLEDNLNRATNQFDRKDYTKYFRLINVAWSGDVALMNYLNAEENATDAGAKLVHLVEQLHSENIEITIIAHSLGNRVLLTAMEKLGAQGKVDLIDQVFMWQAAVPDTALSNNPAYDWTIKQNSKFIHAYKAAKKIKVLYSNRDQVLGLAFWYANYIGMSPNELKQDYYSKKLSYRERLQFHESMSELDKLCHSSDFEALALVGQLADFNLPFSEKFADIASNLEANMSNKYKIHMAMGYNGPNLMDPFIVSLKNSGKLTVVNQSSYLYGHSLMKIPDDQLMKNVYQQQIIGSINHFGRYK